MLVDKLKTVQLVPESSLLKIDPIDKIFSRFDKTVYIKEPIPQNITVSGEEAKYVGASEFFALYSEIVSVELTADCCVITIKNGGIYKLAYFLSEWQDQDIDTANAYSVDIKLVTDRLSSATLKNLANPILQCIYIDEATGVSCNSMVACIDGTVTSKTPLLLPPDVIDFIEGSKTKLFIVDKNYVLNIDDATVYVPIPELDYTEFADTLRSALPENPQKYPIAGLYDSLKRLSISHETVVFEKDRVKADEDFEPFEFPGANPGFEYNIQSLLPAVAQTRSIAQSDYALLLYGENFLFMISPEPTEEVPNVEGEADE